MHVLCVCTGNVCRSPTFVALAGASGLGDAGISLSSAGTSAVDGDPIDPVIHRMLAEREIEAEDFVSRRLTPQVLKDADVVIAMARSHRTAVVEMSPAHVRRTFTVRELARIADRISSPEVLGASPVQRWSRFVEHAPLLRTPAKTPKQDDVPDPIKQSAEVYAEAFRLADDAVRSLSRVIVEST